jgi:hypothetical protein
MLKNRNSGVRVLLVGAVLLAPLTSISLPPAPAHAQGQQYVHMTQQQLNEKLAWLGQELNLSDKQRKKARPIVQDMNSKLMAVKGTPGLTPEQAKSKSIVIVQNALSQIRLQVLDEGRRAKFDQIREQALEKFMMTHKITPR